MSHVGFFVFFLSSRQKKQVAWGLLWVELGRGL